MAAAAPVVGGGVCAARAEMAEAKFMVEICFSFGKSSLCDWKVLYWSMGTTFCTLEEFKNVKDFRYTVNVKFRFKSLLDKDILKKFPYLSIWSCDSITVGGFKDLFLGNRCMPQHAPNMPPTCPQ